MSPPSRSALPLVAGAAALLAGAALLWGMRSLFAPILVGGLLAYICSPFVAGLERLRLTRGLAIAVAFLVFVAAGLLLVSRLRAALPSEMGLLQLRVRALRNINARYADLMGLDPSLSNGNTFYRMLHDDLDPMVNRVNRLLALTEEEDVAFVAAHPSGKLLADHRGNQEILQRRGPSTLAKSAASSAAPARPSRDVPKTPLAALGSIVSTWVVAPAVFLFLLRDTGQIKRAFLRTVPNRLFEPTLAVIADLDHALGGYVRGMVLDSAILGSALTLLFTLLGLPVAWALLIGLLAGAANPVPYVGSAVALLGGLSFVLVADELHPRVPIIRGESVVVFLVAGIALVEVLKNLVVEPLVLGGSVKLHPLVVLIGVLTGGLMFGLVGLVLALPAITIFTTLLSSASRHLKAYGLT